MSRDTPLAFTVVELDKLGFAQVDGAPNTVAMRVTQPGTIVFLGSDAVPATSTLYTLVLELPARFPQVGDAVHITASLLNLSTENSYRITYRIQDSSGRNACVIPYTGQLIVQSPTLYYLGGDKWSGLV